MFAEFLLTLFGEELYNALIVNNPEMACAFILIFMLFFMQLMFNLIEKIMTVWK